MATDITSASTFTTSNMQPASAEIIDSVWGRKAGDNSAVCVGRPESLGLYLGDVGNSTTNTIPGAVSGNPRAVRFWGIRKVKHDNFVGTWSGTAISNASGNVDHWGTLLIRVEGDLGTYSQETTGADTGLATYTLAQTLTVDMDFSLYASENSWYKLNLESFGTQNGGASTGYTMTVEDSKFNTKWT